MIHRLRTAVLCLTLAVMVGAPATAEPEPSLTELYQEVAGRLIGAALTDENGWDKAIHLTTQIGHHLGFIVGLYPLGDDLDPGVIGKFDNPLDELALTPLAGDSGDELTIDFDEIGFEEGYGVEPGVPGPQIVNGESIAEGT